MLNNPMKWNKLITYQACLIRIKQCFDRVWHERIQEFCEQLEYSDLPEHSASLDYWRIFHLIYQLNQLANDETVSGVWRDELRRARQLLMACADKILGYRVNYMQLIEDMGAIDRQRANERTLALLAELYFNFAEAINTGAWPSFLSSGLRARYVLPKASGVSVWWQEWQVSFWRWFNQPLVSSGERTLLAAEIKPYLHEARLRTERFANTSSESSLWNPRIPGPQLIYAAVAECFAKCASVTDATSHARIAWLYTLACQWSAATQSYLNCVVLQQWVIDITLPNRQELCIKPIDSLYLILQSLHRLHWHPQTPNQRPQIIRVLHAFTQNRCALNLLHQASATTTQQRVIEDGLVHAERLVRLLEFHFTPHTPFNTPESKSVATPPPTTLTGKPNPKRLQFS